MIDKKEIAILGVQIASKELGLSEIEIEFKDTAFFYNPDINAMFIQSTYTILFNIGWLEQAHELEILKCAFHETRHAYQKVCVSFPDVMKYDDEKVVAKWKEEFESYNNPNSDMYLEQEIEKDAIDFSERMISKIIEISNDEDEKYKKLLYNQLYSKAKQINDKLLDKSNSESGYLDVSFMEIMQFYMSSHTLGFLKYSMISSQLSYSAMFNARCLIEGFSVIKMYESGNIDSIKENLFKKQFNIFEHNIYSKYSYFDGKVLSFEKLHKDYEDSLIAFESALDNDTNLTKKIIKSRIPFLCDEGISYESIIRKYLDISYLETYKIYSLLIHPHDYGNLYDTDLSVLSDIPLKIIIEIFSDFPFDEKEDLVSDFSFIHDKDNINNKIILESTIKQAKKIKDIAKIFRKSFDRNFITNTLNQIADIFIDITYDLLLGMPEQLKMKWKILIEMMATLDNIYFTDLYNVGYNYEKLRYHTQYKFNENIGNNTSDQLDIAYSLYINETNDGISKTIFENKFKKLLGFMITPNNSIKTLKEFIFSYIDSKYQNQKTEEEILISDILKVCYEESQILSHANGYLYFSNSGAWTEDINIYTCFENLFIDFLYRIKKAFELHRDIEETNLNKDLIVTLGKSIKYIESNYKRKLEVLRKPRISKQLYKSLRK